METRARDRALPLYTPHQKRTQPPRSVGQQRLAALYSQTRDPGIEHGLIEANLGGEKDGRGPSGGHPEPDRN